MSTPTCPCPQRVKFPGDPCTRCGRPLSVATEEAKAARKGKMPSDTRRKRKHGR